MKYKIVLKDENGVDSVDDRFYVEGGVVYLKNVDVRFGNGESRTAADMEFDASNNKLWVKEGVQNHSVHDSIDIGIGRAGNNGATGALLTTPPNMRLGWLWGRSFVSGASPELNGW